MRLLIRKSFGKKALILVSFFLTVAILSTGFWRLSAQSHTPSDIPCIWTGIERIVCVGDLHGAYEHFVTILKGTGLVDDRMDWMGGRTHLVQIGDVLDRGDRAKDILELLIKLEPQAEAAGGKVHALIGNHEEMNLDDTAFEHEGYITPGQFTSFLSESYKNKMEKKNRAPNRLEEG